MYMYSVCQFGSMGLGFMGPRSSSPQVPGSLGLWSKVLGSTEYSIPTVSGLPLNSTAHTIYGLCVWVGGVTMYTVVYSVMGSIYKWYSLVGGAWKIRFTLVLSLTSSHFMFSVTSLLPRLFLVEERACKRK